MLPSIIVQNISKKYKVGTGLTNFRELFSLRKENNSNKYHWAVKDVCFELRPGESLGIIGPNGAGKTTILKMLSRVTKPTSGIIKVNGSLSALIELGAGFHPDLTGRENIFLNGAILGIRRSEIKKRFEKIIDFAGIGEYLDTPVKRYSSGMYARLGFAIAAYMNPDVLLVDEVLAVGDYAFQMKCYARMEELQKNGTTLILVSHNFEVVRRVCERALVLYQGKGIFQGPTVDAIVAYSDVIRNAARESHLDKPEEEGLSQRMMTFDAEIYRVGIYDSSGNPTNVLYTGQEASIVVEVVYHKVVEHPIFSFTIRAPDGRMVYDTTTRWMKVETPIFGEGEHSKTEFKINIFLLDGEYHLGVDVASQDLSCYYDREERSLEFWVKGPSDAQGLAELSAKANIIRLPKEGKE